MKYVTFKKKCCVHIGNTLKLNKRKTINFPFTIFNYYFIFKQFIKSHIKQMSFKYFTIMVDRFPLLRLLFY